MKPKSTTALPLLFPSLLLIAAWFVFGPIAGHLGQDYYREFPRMVSGALYFWQNGWAVPHYSATFCGGIPIFADPQSSYYSLPQFLAFWIDPLVAVRLSLVVFYAMGYFFMFLWLHRSLHYEKAVSHFGALLFILNGFIFANLFVGHLTHHPYLWCPAILYFLFKKTPTRWRNLITECFLFDLIWIYTFYSGGIHMLILFSLLTAIMVPLVYYHRLCSEEESFKDITVGLGSLALSLGVAFALVCSGKLAAILRYSPFFYPTAFNLTPDSPWLTTVRYFWANPWDVVSSLFFGKYRFGIWEFVGFVSKITLLGPVYLLIRAVLRKSTKELVLAILYTAIIGFVCLLASGKGGNSYLPFFRKYHNPIKLFGSLIPLLIWGCIAALNDFAGRVKWLSQTQWRALFFIGLSMMVCIEEYEYFNFYVANKTGLDYEYDPQIYADLKNRETLPPIQRVEATLGADSEAARGGYSSLACYEPIFGYRLEGLLTKVQPGSVFTIRDGYYNINHPGCLLYPEFYGCHPWDRVKETDGEAFKKFLSGDSSAWPVPDWQETLIIFNVIFLLLWLTLPLLSLLTWIGKALRERFSSQKKKKHRVPSWKFHRPTHK